MILCGLTNRYNFQLSGPRTTWSKHQEGKGGGERDSDAHALPKAVCYAHDVALQRGGWVAGLMRLLILKLRVSPSQF